MQFINISDYFLVAWFLLIIIINLERIIHSSKNRINFIGKPSINPILFHTGKITMFATWLILLLTFLGITHTKINFKIVPDIIISTIIATSGILIITGLLNLKNNLRAGLPINKTKLTTKGIYKYTRNPLHLGAFLFAIVTLAYAPYIYVLMLATTFIITHHAMTLSEEKFLKKTFKEKYTKYAKKTPRYFFK